MERPATAEHDRLAAHRARRADWKHWGPYLAERAWGTVREDYSGTGDAWRAFPHDHARSRAYRWNEDGLAGLCDREQHLCFSLALWNGRDPILKERLFGLDSTEGNHGEDVKELYWYLDATPTHSYGRMRYRYPQAAFPYEALVRGNAARGRDERELELGDTGVLDGHRFFDVDVVHAKASERDVVIEITVHNRGPDRAPLDLLPQLWFRNTWSWSHPDGPRGRTPATPVLHVAGANDIVADHPASGRYRFRWEESGAEPLVTDNETNNEKLFGTPNASPWVKDAFHRHVVDGERDAVNPSGRGTKAAVRHRLELEPGERRTIRLRLTHVNAGAGDGAVGTDEAAADGGHAEPGPGGHGRADPDPFADVEAILAARRAESDAFHAVVQGDGLDDGARAIQRQALAGLLHSKQLYYYDVAQWRDGDPGRPAARSHPRNAHWRHVEAFDVLSMPDAWEYPWFAVWDTAFHCLPLALVDPEFAKRQLVVMTREWYMHPNGQLPAYEWNFEDVNPPVHAWAALAVYRLDRDASGTPDRAFLEGLFHKLLLNFTWWVNRKDADGNGIFEGGFLGLDNISLFDRSSEPPTGGRLSQADGTAWMGFFSACMLDIALELARENPAYEDIATKFFEHYLRIARALNGDPRHPVDDPGGEAVRDPGLWDEADGFYHDRLQFDDGRAEPLRVFSLVGLMPMIASLVIEERTLAALPAFARRMAWLVGKRPELVAHMSCASECGAGGDRLLSLMDEARLRRLLARLLDETEFLSPHGIRSLSRRHAAEPVVRTLADGRTLSMGYEPGEGESPLFGGNSNWRGPVWFPINRLLIESLGRYHAHHGDAFTVECPTGSGRHLTLEAVAAELSDRLISLFERDGAAPPAWCGDDATLAATHEEGLHLFFEYFDGDTGRGLGASHQSGWTALVASLLAERAARRSDGAGPDSKPEPGSDSAAGPEPAPTGDA